MGTKFKVDKIFIDGRQYEGLSEVNLDFNSELKEKIKNTPIITVPVSQEATFHCNCKLPWKLMLRWKWEQFRWRRNSKKLSKLLNKCGFTIGVRGDTK